MTIIKVKDIPITSRSGRIYNTSNLTINNSNNTTGGGSVEVDLSNYLQLSSSTLQTIKSNLNVEGNLQTTNCISGNITGNTMNINNLYVSGNTTISGLISGNNGLNIKNIQSATEQYLLMYSPTDGRVTYSNYGLSGVTILTGVTSGYNTSLGYNNAQNNSGNYNTYCGAYIQYNATNSSYNTIIGYTAGYGNTGNYNVFIGYSAGYSSSNLSNKLYIENSSSNSPLIYGEFDNDFVKINGRLQVTGQLTLNSGMTITTSSLSFDNTNKHSSFGTAYLYGKKFGKFNYLTGYVYITSNFSTPAKQLSKINNYTSPGNIVYFTLSNYQTYQNANGYIDTSGNIYLQWGIASNEYYYLNVFWIE